MSTENQTPQEQLPAKLVTPSVEAAIKEAKSVFMSTLGENAKTTFIKEAGFAMMAIGANKKLMACKPETITNAVKCVALTGISLNPTLGLAYLVPMGSEATLNVSYKGMIEILTSSGAIRSMRAAVVFSCDEFNYKLGTSPELYHKPELIHPEGTSKVAAYAIATLPDGSDYIYVMRADEIAKRKQASKMSSSGPWKDWEDEMWIKTVIRSIYKYLPKTKQATQMMEIFDEMQNAEIEEAEVTEVF